MNEQLQFLFVISSKAGRRDINALTLQIRSAYQKAGLSNALRISVTTEKGHLAKLAKAFAERYEERAVVYVCGGDGSLNEAAEVLQNSKAALGVIPTGTANDFAKMLYHKESLDAILAASTAPRFQRMDLLRLRYTQEEEEVHRICLNVLSFGLDSTVLKNTYRMMKRFPHGGRFLYFASVLYSIFGKRDTDIRIHRNNADGSAVQTEKTVTLCALCNGGYYGNGFHPAPNADLTDGYADLVYVTRLGFWELLPLVLRYHKGTHTTYPKVHMAKTVSGVLESPNGTPLLGNYDGFLFETTRLRYEILPGVLRLALPPL